jgi:hypothetical protein
MLPLLGVIGAAVLMAIGTTLDNDMVFLIGGIVLVIFGSMYFKR